jgi:hypothetical protein
MGNYTTASSGRRRSASPGLAFEAEANPDQTEATSSIP